MSYRVAAGDRKRQLTAGRYSAVVISRVAAAG